METKHKKILILLSFAAVYLIWGSTYLAIRIAVETMPAFFLTGVRFLAAGSVLYLIARLSGSPCPSIRQWKSALIIGLSLTVLGNGLVVFAEQRIPSSIAALFIPIVPLWILIIDWLWGSRQRPSWRAWGAVAMGFAGVLILVKDSFSLSTYDVRFTDILAMLTATIAWAAGSVYSRHAELPSSSLMVTGMQMLCGTLILFTISLLSGETIDPSAWTANSILALVYLTVFGSIVAFTAYTYLLKNVPTSLVGTYAFVNPVIAMLLGCLLYDEPVSHSTVLSAVLILGAVGGLFLEGRNNKKSSIRTIIPDELGIPEPEEAKQVA